MIAGAYYLSITQPILALLDPLGCARILGGGMMLSTVCRIVPLVLLASSCGSTQPTHTLDFERVRVEMAPAALVSDGIWARVGFTDAGMGERLAATIRLGRVATARLEVEFLEPGGSVRVRRVYAPQMADSIDIDLDLLDDAHRRPPPGRYRLCVEAFNDAGLRHGGHCVDVPIPHR